MYDSRQRSKWINLLVLFFICLALSLAGCGEKGNSPEEDADGSEPTGGTEVAGDIESLDLEAATESLSAGSDEQAAVRATLEGSGEADTEGITVEFETTAGSFEGSDEAVAETDEDGVAEVLLTPGERIGSAHVTASAEGFSDYITIDFVAGRPASENSSITVDPSVIPADGMTEAEVTVTLADKSGNPVEDGIEVTLGMEGANGEVVSENPATTSSGRVTYKVRSGSAEGTAILYLHEYPEEIPDAEIEFAETEPGEPTSIRVDEVDPAEIAVTEVGENDQTQVDLSLVDADGEPVEGVDYDNLEVSLLARPRGGEFLRGRNSAGENNQDEESIKISTGSDGNASFRIQSGTLPGALELRIEAVDENGNSLDPPIVTVTSRISIVSGPPHTLALSAPRSNALVDLNQESDAGISERPGFYSRRAGLIVTDRYGNAVQDETDVNLGVIDSVIAAGSSGSTDTDGEDMFSDTSADFMEDYVERNGVERVIEPDDRLVIFNTEAGDKSRHVAEVDSRDTLYVTRDYENEKDNLDYAVGSSLLGASIYGVNEDGEATPGTVKTENGLASIRLVYPANPDTIFVGSVEDDPRHPPQGSARVITVFTCSDSGATLVDEGTLSFSSMDSFSSIDGGGPWTLEARPTLIRDTKEIELELVDGGDKVSLPFVKIKSNVLTTSGDPEINVSDCTTQYPSGSCTSTISISDAEDGDEAEITYFAGDAEVTVQFEK